MQIISKFWNNFKTQPDIWFFYGFLITFTLSIRKVLYFFPIKGEFNEYAGIYVYLSDIFLIVAIMIWLITILYNKIYALSIDNPKKFYVTAPLLLVLWAFVSIAWSENYYIALFRSIKLLEFYFIYIYIIFRLVKCSTWNIFMKIIMSVAVFQSILAIFQFILQHSIGLFWLKESLIGSDILGVAKIIVDGEKIIRSYGLFPHPNILGGFLLFSIIITILYQKMFHVEHFSKIFNIKCSTPASNQGDPSSTRGWWNITILCLECFALFLTFSKSAIIGLGLFLLFLCFLNVPRGTLLIYLKKQFKWLILGFILTLAFLSIVKVNLNSFFIKSLVERSFYQNVSPAHFAMQSIASGRGTEIGLLILGVGNGQFVLGMQDYSKQVLEFWQFQPVHNIFLLIWSELGAVGLILFLFFILKILWGKNVPTQKQLNCSTPVEMFHPSRNVPRGTFYGAGVEHSTGQAWNNLIQVYFKAMLLGLIFIMPFDHYLWDIQQGQALLWVVLGLIVVSRLNIDKE